MFCTKCGKEIADNISFCPYCGERIVIHNSTKINLDKPSGNDIEQNISSTETYYKEYHFKSQAKGGGVDVGPITLVEGYSTKTDIVVEDENMKCSQSRRIGKNKENQIKVEDVKVIESGVYFPVWLLAIYVVLALAGTFTPLLVGTSPWVRVVIVAIGWGILAFEVRNIRTIIASNAGRFSFESRDKENVELFKADMKEHPKFKGDIKKSMYLVQKILIACLVICSIVLIVNPNPFAKNQLFKGTYQEWEEARYPDNYRTYIIADITTGLDDTENDSILVLAGDEFDKEIWIANNKGQKIKNWTWLHEAKPIEDNLAIFEITLTKFVNDENPSTNTFVYTDPVAVSPEELSKLFTNLNALDEAENHEVSGEDQQNPSTEENIENKTTDSEVRGNDSNETKNNNDSSNNSISVNYDELIEAIVNYYRNYYGTNSVAGEVDHEDEDTVTIHLYDPNATTTSNNLGFYTYNKKTGEWTDSVMGDSININETGGGYKFDDTSEETISEYYVYVNSSDGFANLRTGPGTEYDIICPISNGEALELYPEDATDTEGKRWVKVAYWVDGGWNTGWVAARLLEF